MLSLKITLVGERKIVKSSLIHRYINNSPLPSNNYYTTNYCKTKDKDNIRLNIWEVSDFISIDLRKLAYPQTNVFLCCFSMNDSVDKIKIWLDEINKYDCPILLVGLKGDLPCEKNEFIKFANENKMELMFTSCEIDWNIEQVFDKAVDMVFMERMVRVNRRRRCCL
ncbi:rho-related GTP-binding protein [Tubulinosema ratisbonensis]|uniref:Rho-related GTP-binding protein n=1 Tax=Tubulinosema ratisbonensis TaxID=291195 RepID=A0A437AQF1_9MICR|nr:rho-related GTP-binding protein [Tubulinosema ratisbonensis]